MNRDYINKIRQYARLVLTGIGILVVVGAAGWYLGTFLADFAHYKIMR